MSTSVFAICAAIGGGITLLAYLIALTVALLRVNRFPQPSILLIAAIALAGLTQIANFALPMVIGYIANPNSSVVFFGGMNLASHLANVICIALMVTAVYAGRGRGIEPGAYSVRHASSDSDNPFRP